MSRYSYLFFILVLFTISLALYYQFSKSLISAEELIKEEIQYGIILKINRFYNRNLRYPDSKVEIIDIVKTLEIGDRIELFKFSKGNILKPAEITFKLKFVTNEIPFFFKYYGCEFILEKYRVGSLKTI